MRPLLWAAGAGTVIGGVLWLAKRSRAPDPVAPAPLQTYGEPVRVTLPVPTGWRRATNADTQNTPDLTERAIALRNTPGFTTMRYGTLAPFIASDGKTYATWIEQHYYEPGGIAKPWGYHHGVTILAKADVAVAGLGQAGSWFIWWIDRRGGGEWFGPQFLSDENLWRYEQDIKQGTPDVNKLYRWVWDGYEWQYDTRNSISLYVQAGTQRYANL